MTIATPWAGVRVLARHAGEIDPYHRDNSHLFRGEEAFASDVVGHRRWSKPSPEPPLDSSFRALVLASIEQTAAPIRAMVERLARTMCATLATPPLLVAILRAGVPISALLAHRLGRWFGADVPVVALSLFAGLGWDDTALEAALHTYPHRPVWFVDGWTGQGGVARELQAAYQRWIARGKPDFSQGQGPSLAVLCDPAGVAQSSGLQADYFVPSSCFTAPETLGFSRGFVTDDAGMFHVYGYPHRFLQPDYYHAWMSIADMSPPDPGTIPTPRAAVPAAPAPSSYRVHSNEVVRALINRNPQEVLFRDDRHTVETCFAPILALCTIRAIPVRYGCADVAAWGTLVAARMGDVR